MTSLDRWPFAPKRDAGGKSGGSAKELAENRAEGYHAFASKQGSFCLWYAAAPCIGEIAKQQIPHSERAEHWDEHSSPRGAPHGVQPHPQSFSQHDEGNDCRTRQGTYHQRQDHHNLIFALS